MLFEVYMGSRSFHLHDGKKGSALAIRVTPRASKDEIVEILSDGTIKVHLTAPPVEGKANEALLKFLSKVLDVPERKLDIVAGAGGRDKLISIIDMDAATLHKKILEHLS
jgi:uncharacterized protein (TIGR00251 family)